MTDAKGMHKKVEVDGKKYSVDMTRANSWKAAKMIARMNNTEDTIERGSLAIEFAEFVLGGEIDKVVKACGGDKATAEDVLNLAYRILGEASKN